MKHYSFMALKEYDTPPYLSVVYHITGTQRNNLSQ